MMKIQVLIAGTFSDFIRPNKVSTKQLAVGDVVDYPDWYAGCMVKMKRAEAYVEAPTLAFEETYQATPAAEKLAAQRGIDLRIIAATGKNGCITVRDVRKAAG